MHIESDRMLVFFKIDKVWICQVCHFKWKHTDVYISTKCTSVILGPYVNSSLERAKILHILRTSFQEWSLFYSTVPKFSYLNLGKALPECNFSLATGTEPYYMKGWDLGMVVLLLEETGPDNREQEISVSLTGYYALLTWSFRLGQNYPQSNEYKMISPFPTPSLWVNFSTWKQAFSMIVKND